MADELTNFNYVNVATAFSKLGKLCGSRPFPRDIGRDGSFRGLMVLARDMVGRCRLIVSQRVLKAPMVSALEATV